MKARWPLTISYVRPTDQARLAATVGKACGVETGFIGSLKSNLAAMALDKVVDAANEQHLVSRPYVRLE